jgi:hypothetical protein
LEDRSPAASGDVAAESAVVEAQRVGVDLEEREQMSDFLKIPAGEPIPLSVLALDLADAPADGWTVWLAERGIAVTFDDVGRPAISRADAKGLLAAQRQSEICRQDQAARLEQQAVEADRAWRAGLPVGVPWYALPDGVSYGQAVAEAEAARSPQRTPTPGEWMFGEADSLVYHELPQQDES